MGSKVINSRADLESIKGTPEYDEFMARLKGSMTRRENHAVYPEGYGDSDYEGPVIEPVWVDVLNLSLIEKFGFTAEDFEDV